MKKPVKKRPAEKKRRTLQKGRSAEIFGVFAKHKFYVNGFTPEEMKTTLEDLGPTYVKIGQIMSSRTDLLPEAYCRELSGLRARVNPLDPAVARSVIERETGKKIDELFREFRDEPLGSASIAQAHYAVTKDGTPVVVKVQRPLVAETMREDFVLLKKIASLVNVTRDTESLSDLVDLKSVIRELEKVTEEELDFRVEAANARLFRENCIEDPAVVSCPGIIDGMSTEKILTMTYVDGYPVGDGERIERDGYDRVAVGKAILENYMHQVLDVGIFHGDPHPGNILFAGGVPTWIDFGMIGRVSEQYLSTFQDIVFALLEKDAEELTNAALNIGIAPKTLNKARLVEDVEAFVDKYTSVKDLARLDVSAALTDLIDVMNAHHISMPGEYTMLMRSLVTIEGTMETLCPELDLFDFLAKKMIRRAREGLNLKESLLSAVETLASSGRKAVRLPAMAFGILRNLSKGKLKINLELNGNEDFIRDLNALVRSSLLVVFSAVLFSGAVRLATTAIEPRINGIPLVSLLGFVVAVAMAVYAFLRMTKLK